METKKDMHGLACWLLEENKINSNILSRYKEPHRHYHTWNHIEDMLLLMDSKAIDDKSILFAIIFHDIVYDPLSSNNEEQSAALFKSVWNGNAEIMNEVCQMILDTKTHIPSTPKSKILLEADLNIFSKSSNDIVEYDKQIFKEYQFADWKKYREGRLDALKKLSDIVYTTYNKKIYDGLQFCIEYFKTFQPKIGVFTGSFNPFHIGHQNILNKAERVFDKVIIARGINADKKNEEFRMLPKHLEHHQQIMYHGLITEMLKELMYPVTLVRGLRNTKDFEYELTMSQYIKDISKTDIPTTLFVCDREFSHVSSSAIKTLPKKEQELYLNF